MVNLKQIDLTNGKLPPDPNYIYFIDEDDPNGDIISMRKPQGGKHEDKRTKTEHVCDENCEEYYCSILWEKEE